MKTTPSSGSILDGHQQICPLDSKEGSWHWLLESDQDQELTSSQYGKAIDAVAIDERENVMVALDNIVYPLLAWVFRRSGKTWTMVRRTEIEPVYSYERVIDAKVCLSDVFVLTEGMNHGTEAQFIRRFDRNLNDLGLVAEQSNAGPLERTTDRNFLRVLAALSWPLRLDPGF
jgi:hypothetical protein